MTEQDFEELGIDFSDEGMLADLRQETEAEAPTEVDEDVVSDEFVSPEDFDIDFESVGRKERVGEDLTQDDIVTLIKNT